jgi:hypothetical protein
MKELAKRINGFDWAYEMSDDPRIFDTWSRIEASIKREIKTLSDKEKTKLINLLTGKGVEIFNRYFN